MKKRVIICIFFIPIFFIFLFTSCKKDSLKFKDGDIIFQTSRSSQSRAIRLATKGPFSHVGIIVIKDKTLYVYEAGKTVRFTLLEDFTFAGEDGKFVVKRLKKDLLLDQTKLDNLSIVIAEFKGRPYDSLFLWSDEEIYCSELVYKIFKRSFGIELGSLEALGTFDLTNPVVLKKLKERYGDNIPYNEKVISPSSIYNSDLLFTVFSNAE